MECLGTISAHAKGIGDEASQQPPWTRDLDAIAVAMRMTTDEAVRFRNHRVSRLIAALPYLAGCNDAERTAQSHLATYVIASRNGRTRTTFDHNQNDNDVLLGRLRTIMTFDGGNQAVIDRGMAILALNMLQGYKHDTEKDRISGEYNPILAGAWDFETIRTKLTQIIMRTPHQVMDNIYGGIDLYIFWSS